MGTERSSHCNEFVRQLSDYIDGDLDASLCAELEVHLAECRDCRVLVDTVRKTIMLYRGEAPAALPLDVQQRLLRVLGLD